jgi:D-sedoheptulose 7-phosphate isomerase
MRNNYLNDKQIILNSFFNHKNTIDLLLDNIFMKKIVDSTNLMKKTLNRKKTIFWCGNGGSAADSQHLSAEMVGRYKLTRKALKSIALTTDTSAITAISNDYNYNKLFSRQLEGLGAAGDLIVAISTSGNSRNIIEVLKLAKKIKIRSIALLGNNGGKCKKYSDMSLIVPSSDTARIQECHILIGHIFCEIIDNYYYKDKRK